MVPIEFLNELVDRFSTATKANQATAGRRGCVVHLGPELCDGVVVSGDLHGNRKNFNKIVKVANLDKFPKRHLVLQEVVHGGPTYPNGGCMSHMLLEDVAKLKVKYPNRVHFLLCNHELSECMKVQLSKAGGSENHKFAVGLENAYGPAAPRIQECYRDFIRSCPLALRMTNGVFISHSAPDKPGLARFDRRVFDRELFDEDLLVGGSAYSIVWGREHDSAHIQKFADMVGCNVLLHGHEPTPAGYQNPNDHQIIFDASGPECWVSLVPIGRQLTAKLLVEKLHRLTDLK
ncbi:MAG: metallophosphoesterase [Planctomycetota bacterium]